MSCLTHVSEFAADCDYCRHTYWSYKHASWFDIGRKHERPKASWATRLISLLGRYPIADVPIFTDDYWEWLDSNQLDCM